MTSPRGGAFAQFRASLREHPPLGPLLGINLLASFTTGILLPILPLFLSARGLTLMELGAAFSLISLAAVGVQILAGRNPVFFARKDVITAFLLVSMLAFPAYLFVDTTWGVVLVGAVSSLAGSAAGPGVSLFLAAQAPPEARATFFGWLGAASSFAYGSAVLFGGSLLAFGYVWVFYAGALCALASFLLVAALLWRGRVEGLAWRELQDPVLRQHGRELTRLATRLDRSTQRLEGLLPIKPRALANARWAAVHSFVFGICVWIYPVYFPLHLQEKGLPLAWVGAVVAASWYVYGLCQPLGARYADRTGRHKPLIILGLAFAALLNAVMALSSLPFLILAWVLLGIADGIGRPLTSALVIECCEGAARANAFGMMGATDTAARVVAPFALAFIIQPYGIEAGFLVIAVVMALSIVPLALVRRDTTPAAPTPTAAPTGGAA